MNDLDLAQLETFADVIELGSFSAAAARRNISQPAVSMQMRALERRLGVRLIERIGKRCHPTAAGQDLIPHVGRIRAAMTEAIEAVAPYQQGWSGRVRLGTGATACIHLLPPLLRRMRQSMPRLEITAHIGNTPDILDKLESNALDIALVTLPAPGRAFAVTPVYEDELFAIPPPEAASFSGPVTPAFLAGQPLVLYEAGGHTRRVIDRWFSDAGTMSKPIMELGSVEAIKNLVEAGLGWAVLPGLSLKSGEAGAPSPRYRLEPSLKRTLALVLRRDKKLDRGLREIIAQFRRLSPQPIG